MDKECIEILESIIELINDLSFKIETIVHQIDSIENNLDISKITDSLDKAYETYSERVMDLKDREANHVTNMQVCNQMINELKGTISMARGALAERKQADGEKYVKEKQNIDSICEAIDLFMNYQNKQYAYFTVKIRDINKALKSIESSLNKS